MDKYLDLFINAQMKRLIYLSNLANFDRPILAKFLRVSKNLIEWWEDTKGVSIQAAKIFADFYNSIGSKCDESWLSGYGEKKPILEIKMDNPIIIEQEVTSFLLKNKNNIAITITDDAMLPLYNSGDYVAGSKNFNDNFDVLVNNPCIIEAKKFPLICRILKNSNKPGYYDTEGVNLNSNSDNLCLSNIKIISGG